MAVSVPNIIKMMLSHNDLGTDVLEIVPNFVALGVIHVLILFRRKRHFNDCIQLCQLLLN